MKQVIESATQWVRTRWGRRILVGAAVLAVGIMIGTAGCTSEGESQGDKIQGMTPATAALKYRLAEFQEDGKTLQQLTVGGKAEGLKVLYPPDQGPQNNKSLPEAYQLTEYEESDEVYLYHLQRTSNGFDAYYEVTLTEEGWKVDDLSSPDFKERIEDLEPHIVKEANASYDDLLEE